MNHSSDPRPYRAKALRLRRAVLQGTGEVLRVALHVEEPVAAIVEGDHRRLVALLCLQREIDDALDPVAVLRRRDESLRLREDLSCLERAHLVVRARLPRPSCPTSL